MHDMPVVWAGWASFCAPMLSTRPVLTGTGKRVSQCRDQQGGPATLPNAELACQQADSRA